MRDLPIRVLHVDDHTAVREVTAWLLARAGYKVDSAIDGEDAWNKLTPDLAAYQVVITDSQMPALNGRELVQRLRDGKFPGRIIVFAAALDQAGMDAFLDLRVDAVVQKGTSANELLSAVRQLTA